MEAAGFADLFDAVDTMARLLGGSVIVKDVDFRVLAYSAVPGQPNDEGRRSAILNRRLADHWLQWMEESGIRERLINSDELIRLDNPRDTSLIRYIQPIRAVDQLVGYLGCISKRSQTRRLREQCSSSPSFWLPKLLGAVAH
jgi:hypothetical protein